MHISLCTISFRHHLINLEDIAVWAREQGFSGIEIWGAHARNIADSNRYNADWLAGHGLSVPMISDYLPLDRRGALEKRARSAVACARTWRAPHIRTFAGQSGSAKTDQEQRTSLNQALQFACDLVAEAGMRLLVETHPGTLADTLRSTCQLIEEIDHPALGINFDALHIWEGGDDPVVACRKLRSKIGNYHFKNIAKREQLPVFAPHNIYNASGSREGIVPLFDGAMPYHDLLSEMRDDGAANVSLEWFGDDVFRTLTSDCSAIRSAIEKVTKPHRLPQAS